MAAGFTLLAKPVALQALAAALARGMPAHADSLTMATPEAQRSSVAMTAESAADAP